MQILQLSTALPRNEYSTEDLMKDFPCRLPDDVKQNVLNLGVSKRCLVSRAKPSIPAESVLAEDGIADLCTRACKEAIEKALKDAGMEFKDIQMLFFCL